MAQILPIETSLPVSRRGRLHREPKVVTSIRVPESLYDAYARTSHATGWSVHMLMISALRAYRPVVPRDGGGVKCSTAQ